VSARTSRLFYHGSEWRKTEGIIPKGSGRIKTPLKKIKGGQDVECGVESRPSDFAPHAPGKNQERADPPLQLHHRRKDGTVSPARKPIEKEERGHKLEVDEEGKP